MLREKPDQIQAVGDWEFTLVSHGGEQMICKFAIALPCAGTAPFEVVEEIVVRGERPMAYVKGGGDGARTQTIRGWNGSVCKPTIYGSLRTDCFHGTLKNGRLE